MTTPAQQYRSLVNKLEQLNELKIGDINPATGKRIVSGATDSEGNLIASGTPGVYWNAKEEPVEPSVSAPAVASEPAQASAVSSGNAVGTDLGPLASAEVQPQPAAAQEKCGPEVKEKIKAQKTFNAAYALAKQSGCDEFDWCQLVTVPTQAGTATPTQQNRQWNWQKGELTNEPGSDLPPAAESIELEESSFVPGSLELDRIREIAGTAVIEQTTSGNQVPEIKAATKQQAIEIARKKGIKTFRFCGKYKVQNAPAKKPPQPQPAKPAQKPTASTQPRRQFGGLNPNVELGPQSGSDLPIAP